MKIKPYKKREIYFTHENENYYYVKYNEIWELFKKLIIDSKRYGLQEFWERVAIGTENKNESLKIFEKYLGGKIAWEGNE